jgi:adenylyltransferase/sulfurtransferase
METIKLLAGFGQTLAGRVLTMDLRTMSFRTLRVRRDPDCPDCRGLPA